MGRYALTAIGRDKPGIVTAVTKVLYENDCNIEDSSMTILEDEFAVILIMSAGDRTDENSLKRDLKAIEESLGLTVRIEVLSGKAAPAGPESNHIIILHGADKSGIVYRTAEILSKNGINITDIETKIVGDEKKVYIMLMEVYSPAAVDLKNVRDELRSLGESLGVTIKMKPIDAYEPL